MNVLNRLSLWKKLAILVMGLLVPTWLLGTLYVRHAMIPVNVSRHELQGVAYLNAMSGFVAAVARHRGQVGAALSGDASFRDAALATQAAADAAMAAVDTANGAVAEGIDVVGRWEPLKAEWVALKARAL